MSNLKLRSLHPDDFERICEIESRITGYSRKGFFEKRLAVATAVPEGFITCAAVDGEKLMGYGFVRIQDGDFGTEGTIAVLDVIGVDPDAHGRDIGKAVVSGIEQRMKRNEIGTLKTQTVWTDQRMTGFFSSVGFKLAPSQILERDVSPLRKDLDEVPRNMDGPLEVHGTGGNDFTNLERDRIWVRSLKEDDLGAVLRIDRKFTGRDRLGYYDVKFKEMLIESGIRVSLVADGGIVTGFVMARVDFGEFGIIDKTAVIDTIGVHPSYGKNGIGQALLSQLIANLSTLRVESVRVQVSWKNFALQGFLNSCGFGPSQRLVLTKDIG